MATANAIPPRRRFTRGLVRALLVVILLAAITLAWFWNEARAYARTGAAYGAAMTCACRFIQGRTDASCKTDFEPGMALVFVSTDEGAKATTATFFPLARQTAHYRASWGCLLED